MFKSEHVEVYLQDTFPAADGEKRFCVLKCYVNPLSYEQACEIDQEIALTLFHKVGANERFPRPLLQAATFKMNLPPYSLLYCKDPKYANSNVYIQTVTISDVKAARVTPGSNDFALIFTVTFEKNDPKVMNDLADLLHEKVYFSFTELQPGLFDDQDPVMELLCRLCDAPNPEYATTNGKFAYCAKHAHQKEDDETLKRIRDTAAAEAAVEEMQDDAPDGNKVTVPQARFDAICKAYSGDTIMDGKLRDVVEVQGSLYAVVGVTYNPSSATLRSLHTPEDWKSETFKYGETRGYTGVAVKCKRDEYVLGPDEEQITVTGPTKDPLAQDLNARNQLGRRKGK